METRVTTYAELEACVKAFKKGAFQVMYIVGDPGHSKTRTVEKILGREPVYLKGGAISPYQLFRFLQENADSTFVLDDCDAFYSDRTAVRLLKALCETEPVRKLGWYTANPHLLADGLKQEFETKSRVVLILNKWESVSKHVESLEDRGIVVDFRPPFDEVMAKARTFFRDGEVIAFVERHRDFIATLSLRTLINASEMRRSGLGNWEDSLMRSLRIHELILLDRILRDARYVTEHERMLAFQEMTADDDRKGFSRDTYFRYKRQLAEIRERARRRAQEDVVPARKPRRRARRLGEAG